ncbi:MAG: hypothetical protein H6828_13865 [Planctomycetes bacterium]|nr:hypothetical protein [Planctomycetota bacterium]
MTGEEWADEPEVPKKKGGLPGWLWFCGGGCLIAVILAVLGAAFFWGRVKEGLDPDVQWAKMDQYLEYDARPDDWSIVFGMNFMPGTEDMFTFMGPSGTMVNLMILKASQAKGREEIFSQDFSGGGFAGINKVSDLQVGEVVVQGRTLPVVRFTQKPLGQPTQAQAMVDITPEGDNRFFLAQFVHAQSTDAVSDETIVDFLKPFRIGPAHVPYLPVHDASSSDEIRTTLELPPEEPYEDTTTEGDGH